MLKDILSTRSLESYVPQIVSETEKFFRENWSKDEGEGEVSVPVAAQDDCHSLQESLHWQDLATG